MTSQTALVLAALISPSVAAVILTIDFAIGWHLEALASASLFPVIYTWVLFSELIVGVPLFILGRKLNLVRWWTAAVAGFLTGFIAQLAMRLAVQLNWADPSEWTGLAFMGAMGAASGLTFWSIWRRGDRAQ